jgi:hypothetical protein
MSDTAPVSIESVIAGLDISDEQWDQLPLWAAIACVNFFVARNLLAEVMGRWMADADPRECQELIDRVNDLVLKVR